MHILPGGASQTDNIPPPGDLCFLETSNRASTNDRAKVRHKIAEGRKKNRKLAKKNPQWKSRVPKDPGIPNSMPFKDQVLAEIAAERRLVSCLGLVLVWMDGKNIYNGVVVFAIG